MILFRNVQGKETNRTVWSLFFSSLCDILQIVIKIAWFWWNFHFQRFEKNKLHDIRIISPSHILLLLVLRLVNILKLVFFVILYLKESVRQKNSTIYLVTHHEQKRIKKEMRWKSFLPDFWNSFLTFDQAWRTGERCKNGETEWTRRRDGLNTISRLFKKQVQIVRSWKTCKTKKIKPSETPNLKKTRKCLDETSHEKSTKRYLS